MRIVKPTLASVVLFAAVTALAQEGLRHVDGPGQFDKYLTPGLLDRWVIDGEKGETIVAHVQSLPGRACRW